MTIASLTPILDAVRAVRAHLEPDVDRIAEAILAGDAEALATGQELMAATDRLVADLAALVPDRWQADDVQIDRCLGVDSVLDAVLIAIGESESDDPIVNERFRPVRLEFSRRAYERFVEDLLLTALERPLTDPERALLDRCSNDLDLIAAGIEPA